MNTQKDNKKKKTLVKVGLLMGIGFVIDVGQAFILYNAGKGAEAKKLGASYKWQLPVGKELLHTAALVLVTSVITGLFVSLAEGAILGNEAKEKELASS